jgi:hypothetical protein
MDRDLQNATPAGERRGRAARQPRHGQRGLPVFARGNLIMSVNQNAVFVAMGPTMDAVRTRPTATASISVAQSTYHGLHVAGPAPDTVGELRVSYLSKAMNNVGENFSSPIDPFDLSKDWGRSDDDQRHRLSSWVDQSADGAGARPVVARHGFSEQRAPVTGAAVQHHLGVTTVQGIAGRPIVNGIHRCTGVGAIFQRSLRLSRTSRSEERWLTVSSGVLDRPSTT